MSDPLASIPLSAIRVFEAAARLKSFTKAADELGITQAAVSWQVKALERRLEQNLFRRLPREVVVTPAGERLARAATEAMTALRSAVSDLTDSGDGVLSLTVLQTVATLWLAPRLGSFQLAHPEIAVRIDTSPKVYDLLREDMDVGIRSGTGDWPGMEALRLFSTGITPLCPPEALAGLNEPVTPELLLNLRRVGAASEWSAWFKAAGVEVDAPAGARLIGDTQVMEIAAAISNQAFALGSPILFAGEIAAGRLVCPFDVDVAWSDGYWLVYPKDRRRARKIAAFREWLLARVAEDPAVDRAKGRTVVPIGAVC